MSTEVARNNAYAHLGEAWFRHQSARILQRHLQYGQHCRLDLDALLAAAAGTMASRHLNMRVANECFGKQPSMLSTSVRVSRLAINGNLLGSPGGDSALDVPGRVRHASARDVPPADQESAALCLLSS
jgi:hypothetical protein